jgi:2-C-methyl-D-erythritol 4-phosphate cytidylyltransferase
VRKKTIAAIIVAGGCGKRMGGSVPKQFISLEGTPILIRALLPFEESRNISTLIVVLPKRWHTRGMKLMKKYHIRKLAAIAPAGKTRQLSVRHGLRKLKELNPDLVIVHDAARPLVSKRLVELVCGIARRCGAASVAIPLHDTIIHVQRGKPVDRDKLLRIQTPQAFDFSALSHAHAQAYAKGRWNYPDDSTLLRAMGSEIIYVPGEATNLKITSKDDIKLARAIIRMRSQ